MPAKKVLQMYDGLQRAWSSALIQLQTGQVSASQLPCECEDCGLTAVPMWIRNPGLGSRSRTLSSPRRPTYRDALERTRDRLPEAPHVSCSVFHILVLSHQILD
uniref:Uncharacterized protein n=1 Tax=Talaromyces marneffei PM1 TaxID=1077442 RepID=A0A093V100_TALMA